MKNNFLLPAILIGLTASASAADLPARMAAPPPSPIAFTPVSTWTGFYFGGAIGGAWGRSATTNIPGAGAGNGFDEGPFATRVSNSPSGLVSSVHLGFNYQFGAAVLGIEAELGGLGLKKSTFLVTVPPDDAASVRYRGFGTLTARAGYAFGNTLLYVKGGLAAARIRNAGADLIDGTRGIDVTDLTIRSSTSTGYAIGGGIEHMLWNNVTVRAEYLYMDFQRKRSGNIDGDVFSHRNNVHLVRLGLSYLFNSSPGAIVAKY